MRACDTRDRRLDVQDGFLLAKDGGPLADDSQGHGLLHTALLGQVCLEQVHARLPFAVKHFLQREAVAQGEGDS